MKIKIKQHIIKNTFQPWLETIILIDDKELERLNDWVVGYYYCSHCKTSQGFSYQLPPVKKDTLSGARYQAASAHAHNERNAFWRAHAHGDGRIILFERDMPEVVAPTDAIITIHEGDISGPVVGESHHALGRGTDPVVHLHTVANKKPNPANFYD